MNYGKAQICHNFETEGMMNMKFIISGKNIDVTDSLRTAVEDKLSKLEKYFTCGKG